MSIGALRIARREFGGYFTSVFGWLILALVLALDGVLFNGLALSGARPSSEVIWWFFYFSAGVTLAASVFVAMPTFAGERERGTLVLLRTSPLSEWDLVVGKFLGAYAFVAVLILATLYMPLLVVVNGQVAWGQVLAGYTGLLLMALMSTAIGVFASALSKTQVVAAVIGGVLVVFFLVTWYLARAADPPINTVLAYLAIFNKHFTPFMEGTVHTRSVVFYISVAYIFLLGATRALQARRWR